MRKKAREAEDELEEHLRRYGNLDSKNKSPKLKNHYSKSNSMTASQREEEERNTA